jgi:hypothetical protein
MGERHGQYSLEWLNLGAKYADNGTSSQLDRSRRRQIHFGPTRLPVHRRVDLPGYDQEASGTRLED